MKMLPIVKAFVHYDGCTPNYPEKDPSEPAGLVTSMEIDDGDLVWQCVDCGAWVVEKAENRRKP